MNRLIVTLVVVLGLVFVGGTAQADTCTFDTTSGDWDEDSNWDCAGGGAHEPTAADRAIIPSGKTCNIDSAAVADSLSVTGTLNIEGASGNSLTLDDDANDDTTIAGTLNLQGANSVLAFTDSDQTINGAGKIVGQHSGATISIEISKTLTSDTTIEGKLQITGSGDFVNHGTVHANVAGPLLIDCNSIEDDSGGLWKISVSSAAILRINVDSGTAAVLEGDFEIFDDGKLDVDSEGFTTTGTLDWRGGKIDVAGGSSVEFGT